MELAIDTHLSWSIDQLLNQQINKYKGGVATTFTKSICQDYQVIEQFFLTIFNKQQVIISCNHLSSIRDAWISQFSFDIK